MTLKEQLYEHIKALSYEETEKLCAIVDELLMTIGRNGETNMTQIVNTEKGQYEVHVEILETEG